MRILPLPPVEVFAVEPTTVQIVWRTTAPGKVTITVDDDELYVDAPNGPTALVVDELNASTRYRISVQGPGVAWTGSVTTETPPPGRELVRVATINDCHIGLARFGVTGLIRDHHPDGALRCARAAIAEALEWGAEHLVIKGDLVNRATPDEWRAALELVESIPVPVSVLAGNHEAHGSNHRHSRAMLARLGDHGADTRTLDLPGIRVVLLDTTIDASQYGRVHHAHGAVVDAAATAEAALVLHHHHLHPARVPVSYPIGVFGRQVGRFLDDLAEANPATMLSSGHTHRHRRRVHSGLTLTEVGSTKDYPGTWCGFAVHEGGIRQVVRRVADPDRLMWTEKTAACLAGLWPRYSPGPLDQRCFSLAWPT